GRGAGGRPRRGGGGDGERLGRGAGAGGAARRPRLGGRGTRGDRGVRRPGAAPDRSAGGRTGGSADTRGLRGDGMTRILVVEDNPDLAYGLRNNLEIEGYEVEVVEDGSEGLARARTGGPDLIILDLITPRL